jgi:hypothetical protein
VHHAGGIGVTEAHAALLLQPGGGRRERHRVERDRSLEQGSNAGSGITTVL